MKKDKILNAVLQIPYILLVIVSTFLVVLGEKINILTTVISMVLLFISGYGLSLNNHKWNIAAFISILIFTIWYCIMGYFDSMRWTSTIIGVVLLLFYCIVFLFKRKINNM